MEDQGINTIKRIHNHENTSQISTSVRLTESEHDTIRKQLMQTTMPVVM